MTLIIRILSGDGSRDGRTNFNPSFPLHVVRETHLVSFGGSFNSDQVSNSFVGEPKITTNYIDIG